MGDEPIGLVRRSEQAEAIASCGIQTVRGDLVAMAVDELAATIVELLRTPALSRLTLDLTRGGTAISEGMGALAIDSTAAQRIAQEFDKTP